MTLRSTLNILRGEVKIVRVAKTVKTVETGDAGTLRSKLNWTKKGQTLLDREVQMVISVSDVMHIYVL